MIEIIKAILFGIIEGITEWLPISSTGHMIILDAFVKLNCSPDFLTMFLIVIQLGAILAVILLFWNKIFPFQFSDRTRSIIDTEKMIMWLKIVVACIPAGLTVVFGIDEICENLFYKPVPVAIALILFGIVFIIIEKKNKGRRAHIREIKDITFKTAFLIGMFQLLAALFPGTSRSGATIIGGLMLGLSRVIASEFTFFLAIPVMLGASALKIIKFGFAFSFMEMIILVVGMVVAFLVSIIVIRLLMNYIKKHDFQIFGWYRIILGILVILCDLIGVI